MSRLCSAQLTHISLKSRLFIRARIGPLTHPSSSPCAHLSGCVASPRCDAPHVALHADPLDAGGRQTGRDTSCSTRVPDTTRALACLFTAPLRLTALFDLLFVCAHLRFSSQPARWASSVLAWDDRCVCFAGVGAHESQRLRRSVLSLGDGHRRRLLSGQHGHAEGERPQPARLRRQQR